MSNLLEDELGPQWELYCEARAAGKTIKEAAHILGKDEKTVHEATRRHPEIAARIRALQVRVANRVVKKIAQQVTIDRTWLSANVIKAATYASRVVPVTTAAGNPKIDTDGNPITKLADMAGFLKALELGGRMFGAFSDRVIMNEGEKQIANMSLDQVRAFVKKQEETFARVDPKHPGGAEGSGSTGRPEGAAGILRTGSDPGTLQ